MPVDQTFLDIVDHRAPDELTTLTSQYNGIVTNIADWTDQDTLYNAMMSKAQSSLITALNAKMVTLGANAIEYGSTFGVSNISDWEIVMEVTGLAKAGSSATKLINKTPPTVDFTASGITTGSLSKVFKTGGAAPLGSVVGISSITTTTDPNDTLNFSALSDGASFAANDNYKVTTTVYRYDPDYEYMYGPESRTGSEAYQRTYRLIIPAFTTDFRSIRLQLIGHNANISKIITVSVAERLGATSDIVTATKKSFTWNGGEDRIEVQPDATNWSDWLDIIIDQTKTYCVTFYVDGYAAETDTTGVSGYKIDGDQSATDTWTTLSGVTGVITFRALIAIQGIPTGAAPGWDGDVWIQRWIIDWSKTYPLITSYPFGTTSMLASLNQGRSIISGRKTQITNRNAILTHYKTYTITALAETGCTITPNGSVSVDWGKSQTFTFAGGSSIVVDGVAISSVAPYTFTNVTEDHAIQVLV